MQNTRLALAAACVFSLFSLNAEELRLKTRTIDPAQEGTAAFKLRAAGSNPRSVSGRKWHWLVHFENAEPDLKSWEDRGARILASVPVNGYIISVPDAMSWDDLPFVYRSPIEAGDKMSPQILAADLVAEGQTQQLVLVHFHKDVEAWEATAILEAEGVTELMNGSLEAEDRLAEITTDQMAALALWDEVEYIFPAPPGMKTGEMYLGCGGVISGGYEVAMLAASYGEGWDGPGRGRASISYSFGNLGTRVDPAQTRAEAVRAMAEWSKAVAVTFTETTVRNTSRNIDILFATGQHGDPFPFQSGSTVLGHSFYPANPNPEPLAGDIHINDAWGWSIGGQWDIFSVILHELGHSLGIGHTDTPGSVMYPYYQQATGLKQPDIDSIRQLYAAPSDQPAPPLSISIVSPAEGFRATANLVNVSGAIISGAPGITVAWRNESTSATGACLVNSVFTTYSCAAVPINTGSNTIRVEAKLNTATVSAVRVVTREANGDVALAISSPAANTSTTASQIRLTGTASHTGGIARVTWVSNRSRSGTATGLDNWSATVDLELGINEITVTATARSGISSTRKITIERKASAPAPPTNPGGDRVPPSMTIQQPIGNFIITSANKLTFRGTASDNVGVTQVTWTNSAGDQSGAATAAINGSSVNWSFDVNIAVGFNAIQVRAWDAAGNSTLYSTTVRRY